MRHPRFSCRFLSVSHQIYQTPCRRAESRSKARFSVLTVELASYSQIHIDSPLQKIHMVRTYEIHERGS